MASSALKEACLFCKIIRKEIPSFKLLENDKVFAFLDIGPCSKGHCLVIPKFCAEQMHEIPDDYLAEVLPAVKKVSFKDFIFHDGARKLLTLVLTKSKKTVML